MDKVIKIGRIVAYLAETVMAIFVVTDTIDNLASKKKAKNTDNNGTAESKATQA